MQNENQAPSPDQNGNDIQPRKGLGRGLSALFNDEINQKTSIPNKSEEGINGSDRLNSNQDKAGQAFYLPIELLKPNPHQPRKSFEEENLETLTNSILSKGVLQPILVRLHPETKGLYQIVAGERRWRAAQRANLHEVPVTILTLKDTDSLEIALIENIHRQDLNPLEEAEAYQQLINRYQYTQETTAKAVGKSRSHVANLLRLLALPEEIKAMIQDGHLTMGHARALLGSKNPLKLAHEIIDQGLNVRQVEKIIQNETKPKTNPEIIDTKKAKSASISPIMGEGSDANSRALAKDLSHHLGMNVAIEMAKDQEAGILTIAFKNIEQLDDLIMLLSNNKSDFN